MGKLDVDGNLLKRIGQKLGECTVQVKWIKISQVLFRDHDGEEEKFNHFNNINCSIETLYHIVHLLDFSCGRNEVK
jgi:hypothetical protein